MSEPPAPPEEPLTLAIATELGPPVPVPLVKPAAGVGLLLAAARTVGLAVAQSQGDMDITLTSVVPYAHWIPRSGLGSVGVGRGRHCGHSGKSTWR